jgi:hypothetical protein
MTPSQKKTLYTLKAIENKAYAAMSRGLTSTEALAVYGEDAAYLAWAKAAEAVRSFGTTLPYGGR